MTVRTRKTITDLIQQLKSQEKEIKSGLSDGQRRLNETRDRISTLYWVIEEIGDCETEEESGENPAEEYEEISKEEWEDLVKTHSDLTAAEIEDILHALGFFAPAPYDGCPCKDCSSVPKPKPKKKSIKKFAKKTKKGKK
jgi:hypothetical protein